MVFETQYRLATHKKNENHYLRRKRGKDNGDADKVYAEKKERRQLKQQQVFSREEIRMKLVVPRASSFLIFEIFGIVRLEDKERRSAAKKLILLLSFSFLEVTSNLCFCMYFCQSCFNDFH